VDYMPLKREMTKTGSEPTGRETPIRRWEGRGGMPGLEEGSSVWYTKR
jgi:hypothetical protein